MIVPAFSRQLSDRSRNIVKTVETCGVDGLLLNSEANVSYITGFHTPDSYLIHSSSKAILITDFRYASDFKRVAVPPIEVLEYKGSIFKTIARVLKEEGLKRIGFESRHLTFAECEILNKLKPRNASLIPLAQTVEGLREIKDKEEISKIRHAVAITRRTFSFVEKILKIGLTELRVAAEIEHFIRLQGAQKSAFDIIVASGPNSSFAHAAVSNRVIKNGDPVVIDMGVEYNGYKCDLTRTFFLGKISPIAQKANRIVCEAQKRAISKIRPGAVIKDIDRAARYYIAAKGFGKNFGHALGHGVGLEIHESPSINRKNNHRIKKGMIFTVEPGIYLAGEFGIRQEEMVLVTDNGAEVL